MTVLDPTVVGVPVTTPVGRRSAPGPPGSPDAEYVNVWPASGSDAEIDSGAIAVPCTLDRFPGEVTDGAWFVAPPVMVRTTMPERLAAPPDVVTANEPAVTFTV